jgi:hypothetical protein
MSKTRKRLLGQDFSQLFGIFPNSYYLGETPDFCSFSRMLRALWLEFGDVGQGTFLSLIRLYPTFFKNMFKYKALRTF